MANSAPQKVQPTKAVLKVSLLAIRLLDGRSNLPQAAYLSASLSIQKSSAPQNFLKNDTSASLVLKHVMCWPGSAIHETGKRRMFECCLRMASPYKLVRAPT